MTSTKTPSRPSGRRPRKQHSLWFKVAVRTVLSLVGLFVLGVIALVVIYLRTDIPPANADANAQSSIIYYSDGTTQIGKIGQVNRVDVKLSQVPKQVQEEFLSAEDRNFYSNNGISPKGIVRALWNNLTGRPEQGGSTITQQYVKNYFLSQDRSITRKLKEAMISIKIDQKYSKSRILQDYLNNTYFGRGAYGIQAASRTYFGVDASQLNISQGAFLASVINAPGLYDPANGKAAAQRANARMVYVLDGMVSQGWMSKAQRATARFPHFQPVRPPDYGHGTTGYILREVSNALSSELHLSPQDIARGGLRITTTIDKHDQKAAVTAVEQNVPSQVARIQALHAGLIAQKPDGAIVAMFGGRDFAKNQYNSATQARMQAGSSFKVFTLTAALQKGIPLTKRYSGKSPLVIGKDKFQNDQHEQFGNIDLTTALAHSVNTVFLQLNQDVGPKNSVLAAQRLGIPATDPGMLKSANPDLYVNNVLGVASVSVANMANAYSTLSNDGKKATPYLISKVTSTTGDYSYTAHPKTTRAVPSAVAADVTNAMSHVLTDPGATAHATAGQLNRPAAGKTGTTNGFKSAWFTGFTPGQLTASVGMYAGTGKAAGTKPLAQAGAQFYGGNVPATIWLDFMQAALQGQPVAKLPKLQPINGQPMTTTVAPPPVVTQQPTSPPSTSSATPAPPSTTQAPSSTSSAPPPSTTTSSAPPPPPSTSSAPPPPTVRPPQPTIPPPSAPKASVAPPVASTPAPTR